MWEQQLHPGPGAAFPQPRRESAERLPGSPLPSVGYRATAMGLYSIWLLDSFAHDVAKVTEKGRFFNKYFHFLTLPGTSHPCSFWNE